MTLSHWVRYALALAAASSMTIPSLALACLNEYKQQPQTQSNYLPQLERIIHSREIRSAQEREEPIDLGPLAYSTNIEERNDFAVRLIRAGRLGEAIAILIANERDRPGDYATATNLGTAYELSGDDDEAIKWISRGVHRNSGSHQGTEWLHIDILATKILRRQKPNSIDARRVLPASFDGTKGIVSVNGSSHDLDEVRLALEVQLGERLAFVAPPDELVGGMLADLGMLLAKEEAFAEKAETILAMALEYGAPNSAVVQRQLASVRWTVFQNTLLERTPPVAAALLLAVVLTCIVLTGLAVLRAWKRRQAAKWASEDLWVPHLP